MQHPAMGSWFLQSRAIYARAERVLTGSEVPTHEAFAQMIAETLQEALDSGDTILLAGVEDWGLL